MITPPVFRQNFQAFADPGVYDDASIKLYLGIANNMLDNQRWGGNGDETYNLDGTIDTMGTLDYGICLFTAHHLVLTVKDNVASTNGGTPGTVEGIRSQKAVDKVSVSYDTTQVLISKGDFWNMTTYGIRFLHLARMMGTGGALNIYSVGPLGSAGLGWPGFASGGGN